MARGWTRSFTRPPEGHGPDFLPRLLEGLARIAERAQEDEAHRELRLQMKQLFGCEDVSLFVPDPGDPPRPGEGDWSLTVVNGWGEGNVVTQADTGGAPTLLPGQRQAANLELARAGMLKAIALAYEEDRPWGLDVEEDRLVLLRDPIPSDDLGSGDLSVLALPIRHRRRVGRVVECAPLGVLTLYRVPTRIDLSAIERPLRALLAGALAEDRHAFVDPTTGLMSEGMLRRELARQVNLFDLTRGKLRGGFVAGWIDTLCLYKQGLESVAALEADAVSRAVSALLRAVGGHVRRRAGGHQLGAGPEHRCGVAGRIGAEGFGVILPALSAQDLCNWGRALQQDVTAHPFPGEHLLAGGEVTVSLRVIPFGTRGAHTDEALWRLATGALEELGAEQRRRRGTPDALRPLIGTLLARHPDGSWVTPARLRAVDEPAGAAPSRPDRPTRALQVDGVGTLLDEHPPEPEE